MDLTHWVLVGILLLSVLIAVGGFVWMSRILGKDEATRRASLRSASCSSAWSAVSCRVASLASWAWPG